MRRLRGGWLAGVLLVLALLGWVGLPALAEEEDAAALNARVEELYQQGRYQEAIPLAERAMHLREKALGPEHADTIESLHNLASLYDFVGDFGRAEPLYQRALATREKVLGPEHPDTATSLNNLAYLYAAMGDYGRAEPLYQRALAIREKALGAEHPDTATSLNSLAGLYDSMGDYACAEPLYLRALAIREQVLGPEHPDTSISVTCLARLFQRMGDRGRAEPLFQRALAIDEKTLGPEHPTVAIDLTDLADLYAEMGDYGRAEPLHQRALAIRERVLGPEHLDTATSLNNLAKLYYGVPDYGRAEPLYQRALAIREKVLGPDHPDTASSLNDLAALYNAMGDYGRAEPLYQRALAIREKVLGPDHPQTALSLNNLAALYNAMGDYGRAEPLFQRALAICEKALGPEHPDTATSLNNLAALYYSMGDYARAEPLSQRALSIWEKVLGPEHPDTATSLNNLAALYYSMGYSMGDYARAEPLSQRALSIREKVLGPEHPDTATSLNNLAALYDSMGDYARAEPLYQRALAIHEKALGPEHPQTALSLSNLAFTQIDLARPEAALALTRRATQAEEATLANVLSFTSEKQRLAFQATLNPYTLPATLASAPDIARAVLHFKGVVLDSLVEDLRVAGASENPSVRDRVAALRQAKARLMELTLEAPRELSSEQLKLRAEERARLEADTERMEGELAREVAGLGQARQALSVTVEQVQAALPEGAVLVEFLRHNFYLGKGNFEERYGAVVLLRTGPPRWVVLGKAEDLEQQVRSYQQAVGAVRGRLRTVKRPTQEWSSAEALEPGLRALYDSLWAPLEKSLPAGTRTVILSPDGELNFVSWASLLTPEDRFLAQQYELLFVSSGRDLLKSVKAPSALQAMALGDAAFSGVPAVMASKPGPASGSALAASGFAQRGGLVPPEQQEFQGIQLASLPGTRAEVDGLEALLKEAGWKVEMAQGPGASEAWVRSARSPRVLHLATHGFFLPIEQMAPPDRLLRGEGLATMGKRFVNPMQRSGLALTGAQTTFDAWKRHETPAAHRDNDGVLTADEAGTLDLSGTWLVCLSACETAQGEARAGEGVLGLRRGFVQAGARNLLMTLWSVADDETARFMADFYRAALADGRAPSALARTQRDWLVRLRQKEGLDAAVYLVGPFQLNFQGQP